MCEGRGTLRGGHLLTDHPLWGLVDVYATTIPSTELSWPLSLTVGREPLTCRTSATLAFQGVERWEADIGHEMIGRWREARPDHALGLDTGGTHEPRPGVGQMLLAIGAIEFRGVLG